MKKLTRLVKKFKGISIGLDVHIKFIQWQAIDERGSECGAGRFASTLGELAKWMGRWTGKKIQFALETSGSVYWVYDMLAEKFGEKSVCAVQPAKMPYKE